MTKMKKWQEELNLIEKLIRISCPGVQPGNSQVCVSRFCAEIDETDRSERAEYFRQEFSHNNKMKQAADRLASICNEGTMECDHCEVKKFCNTYVQHLRNEDQHEKPNVIDLFCGAGGLSLGFTQAGFQINLANDIEACCIETYAFNHPEVPGRYIIRGDLNEVLAEIEEWLRFPRVDVVIGGPPCQGFSMANRQRLIDDPRNQLYRSYVRVVEKVKPLFFVMENVRGMLSVADEVVEDFNRIGYDVTYQILNARDFGVPQHRERLIFIGNNGKNDNERIFDEIKAYGAGQPETVLQDALSGLKPLEASRLKNATECESEESGAVIGRTGQPQENEYIRLINQGRESPVVYNHKACYNNDRDIEIFRRLSPGDRSDDPKIADIMPYASRNHIFKDKYFKLENDRICKTITAHMKFDCNMYIHPTQARGLTPREAARVQSYPDDYFFHGAYTKTYMQVGNSVPPLLGRAIATILRQYMG